MIYQCKGCGGNVVYDPQKKKMVCESCGNENQGQWIPQKELHTCSQCGAVLEESKHFLSGMCPYCRSYLVFEDRLERKPDLVLPFAMDKHKAGELLRERFGNKIFLPSDFCRTSSIEKMQGLYVPFFMYDFHSEVRFKGEGDVIRTWREGDYECTETKTYRLIRDFDVEYDKIPVDASVAMDDSLMDLLEPYRYDALGDFAPEYLSGFYADTPEEDSGALKPRAEKKANRYSEGYLSELNAGYASVRTFSDKKENQVRKASYAFLPVWKYVYRYQNKNYEFYINGQTGKVSGAPPISKSRVALYGCVTFAVLLFFLEMLISLLGVL